MMRLDYVCRTCRRIVRSSPAIGGNVAILSAVAALVGFQAPVAAQITVLPRPPDVVVPSPDRIEAATELLEILMPPGQRQAMISQMLGPMLANIEQGMAQSPEFQADFAENPQAQSLFTQFMARQRVRTIERMNAQLPDMFAAMTRAYARRFTENQMEEIGEFFESNAGRAYLRETNAIMADPDIAAWQRRFMAASMREVRAARDQFTAEMQSLGAGTPNRGSGSQSANSRMLDAMRGSGETETNPSEDAMEEEQ